MIEFIDHTADIGIKVCARSLEELFKLSAYGMFKIICENVEDVEAKEVIEGKVISEDINEMLYLFLESLLVEFDKSAIILRDFEVNIKDNTLNYKAYGEYYNAKKHKIGIGIKSPTYHKMKIWSENENFYAIVIFDI